MKTTVERILLQNSRYANNTVFDTRYVFFSVVTKSLLQVPRKKLNHWSCGRLCIIILNFPLQTF